MASWLRKLNLWAHKFVLLIAEAALIAMVIIVTMTVVLRYVFNSGIGWAEEVPRLLVTLFAFIAMAMGVRDRSHISVNIVYNLFPKEGKARRFMVVLGDVVVLLCGLFMLYFGGRRYIQQLGMPGSLPMTGWDTSIQYLPIPIAGFMITFDSILFLTGVVKRDDLLYSEPDADYVETLRKQQEEAKEDEA